MEKQDTYTLKSVVIAIARLKSEKYGTHIIEFAEIVRSGENAQETADRRATELRLAQWGSYDSHELTQLRIDHVLINDTTGEEQTLSRNYL